MPTNVKIHADRRYGLCGTCRSGQITEFVDGKFEIYCDERSFGHVALMRAPVVRCTEYDERCHATRHDMEKIAWRLRTDKSGKTIGFGPPIKDKDND